MSVANMSKSASKNVDHFLLQYKGANQIWRVTLNLFWMLWVMLV